MPPVLVPVTAPSREVTASREEPCSERRQSLAAKPAHPLGYAGLLGNEETSPPRKTSHLWLCQRGKETRAESPRMRESSFSLKT